MIVGEDDGYKTNEEMKKEWLREKQENEENVEKKGRKNLGRIGTKEYIL